MAIIEFDPKKFKKEDGPTLTFIPMGASGTKFSINTKVEEFMKCTSSTHILPKYDDEKEILTLELNNDRGVNFTDSKGKLKRQASASKVFNAMSQVMNIEHKLTLTFESNESILTCKVPKRIKQ
ncbi:hypothetical protein [Bacillus bombysepticus]|uniref:hypothetical protein n=1 Tax=Bacillus bombysepticus TaxID=658666 RepID=UPI0030175D25